METWEKICSILAPDSGSEARKELMKVAGEASSTISSEGPTDSPFIAHGSGPRIHVYCVYGEDAVSGEGVEEEALTTKPTAGDWSLSMPVPEEDLEWTRKSLKGKSTRITARASGEALAESKETASTLSSGLSINESEFYKP
ncbi:MAG: hypothetical protein IPN85_15025 [Flavobacteriales bacterium]|nr:hypothetical protein [Flavobacteriales bacterium]